MLKTNFLEDAKILADTDILGDANILPLTAKLIQH